MKNNWIRISAFFLLLALTVEATGSFLLKNSLFKTELTEKEGKGKSQETELEKDDLKDKVAPRAALFADSKTRSVLIVAANTFFLYAAYLSLPEIPPDRA